MKKNKLAFAISAAIVSAPASAAVYTETSTDTLAESFATRTLLSPVYNSVFTRIGSDRPYSVRDYFSFTGLTAGDSFSTFFDCSLADGPCGFSVLDNSGATLFAQDINIPDPIVSFSGTVDSSGQVNIAHLLSASEYSEGTVSIDITPAPSNSVPVTSTALLLGAGLVAGSGFSRRRRQHTLKD